MPPVPAVLKEYPRQGRRHLIPPGTGRHRYGIQAQEEVAIRRSLAKCGSCGCGQTAGVDVLVTMPRESLQLALRVGGYCAGHAVIVGIDAQAGHDGEIRYSAPLDITCAAEMVSELD